VGFRSAAAGLPPRPTGEIAHVDHDGKRGEAQQPAGADTTSLPNLKRARP